MDINTKLAILENLYRIYDEYAQTLDTQCRQYCDHCCTRNVTLTTLEGQLIINHLTPAESPGFFKAIENNADRNRFSPLVTINKMADMCAKGQDPPDEDIDPAAGPCPVICDKSCPVYPVRPFNCRCMVSASDCGKTGYADMDELTLAVNNIFLQYVEHIDAQGLTGNFTDILLFLKDKENQTAYAQNRPLTSGNGLIANQPVFVLMVPPQFRKETAPLIKKIQGIRI